MHLGSTSTQGKSSSFNPSSFFESNLNALGGHGHLAKKYQNRSNVIMSAATKEDAPTVTGEIDITPKEGHLDMIFYD
jgi:fructose-bisphosphate aldolase class I